MINRDQTGFRAPDVEFYPYPWESPEEFDERRTEAIKERMKGTEYEYLYE